MTKLASVIDITDSNVIISSDDKGGEEIEGDAGAVSILTLPRSGRRTARPSLILKPWLARKQLCHVGNHVDTIPWVNGPPVPSFTLVMVKYPSKETMAWLMKQEGMARHLKMHECSRQSWKHDKKNALAMKDLKKKKRKREMMVKMKKQDVGRQQVPVITKVVPDDESVAE